MLLNFNFLNLLGIAGVTEALEAKLSRRLIAMYGQLDPDLEKGTSSTAEDSRVEDSKAEESPDGTCRAPVASFTIRDSSLYFTGPRDKKPGQLSQPSLTGDDDYNVPSHQSAETEHNDEKQRDKAEADSYPPRPPTLRRNPSPRSRMTIDLGPAPGGMWENLKDDFNIKIEPRGERAMPEKMHGETAMPVEMYGETAMPAEMPPEEVREIRKQDFFTRLQKFYEPTVYNAKEDRVTINLASLHRIQLMVSRHKLVKLALVLRYGSHGDLEDMFERDRETLGSVMHEYSKYCNCLHAYL